MFSVSKECHFCAGFDEEAAAIAAQLFAQGPLRKAFMQKVLGIVCAQLLVTALVAALFYLCKPVKVRTFPLMPHKQQDQTHPLRASHLELPTSMTCQRKRHACSCTCSAMTLSWQQIMQRGSLCGTSDASCECSAL